MKLHDKTTEELLRMMREIEDDPENKSPDGGLYLYIPSARMKLDAIARAIAANTAEKRAAAGDPVKTDGYSGRQSKRR